MVSTHIGFPTETVIVFIALSVGAIFIDLFMHRDDKPISLKSAALWSRILGCGCDGICRFPLYPPRC